MYKEWQEKPFDLRVILIAEMLFAVKTSPLSEETRLDFRRDYQTLRDFTTTEALGPEQIEAAITQQSVGTTHHYRVRWDALQA